MVVRADGVLSRQRILVAIAELSAKYEYSPTVRQIAEQVGLSPSTVHKHLTGLARAEKVITPSRVGAGWRLTEAGLAEALWTRSHSGYPT